MPKMLELHGRKLKINMINVLKDLMENMCDQMGNSSREMELVRIKWKC